MYENIKLPDGSQWFRSGGEKLRDGRGFTYLSSEYGTVRLENGAGKRDLFEIYVSKSGCMIAVVTWDPSLQYIGGTIYGEWGRPMCENFVQDEAAEDFFRLSRANMVKKMIDHLHQIYP